MVRNLKTGSCDITPSVELYRWEGAFTRFGVCIGVRGLKRGSILVALENGHEGKLKIVDSLSETVNECAFEKIRLVGRQGKIWFIDPDPEVISQDWHLWTFGNCPLKDLQWDPGSLFWQCPYSQQQKKLEFFQYSAKLGRQILQATSTKEPTSAKYWTLEGISDERLKKTWRKLWDRGTQRKIFAFQWLIIHKATPTGVWLGKGHFPTTCPCYRLYEESQRHCLWDCRWAQEIWKRILRVFSPSATNLTFTWGAVVWSSL